MKMRRLIVSLLFVAMFLFGLAGSVAAQSPSTPWDWTPSYNYSVYLAIEENGPQTFYANADTFGFSEEEFAVQSPTKSFVMVRGDQVFVQSVTDNLKWAHVHNATGSWGWVRTMDLDKSKPTPLPTATPLPTSTPLPMTNVTTTVSGGYSTELSEGTWIVPTTTLMIGVRDPAVPAIVELDSGTITVTSDITLTQGAFFRILTGTLCVWLTPDTAPEMTMYGWSKDLTIPVTGGGLNNIWLIVPVILGIAVISFALWRRNKRLAHVVTVILIGLCLAGVFAFVLPSGAAAAPPPPKTSPTPVVETVESTVTQTPTFTSTIPPTATPVSTATPVPTNTPAPTVSISEIVNALKADKTFITLTRGDKGDIGPAGQSVTGPQGPAGRDGQSGNRLFVGEDPFMTQANDGDVYIETTTGLVWQHREGHWENVMNITGPQGPKGEGFSQTFIWAITIMAALGFASLVITIILLIAKVRGPRGESIIGPQGPAGLASPEEVVSALKADSDFVDSLRGEPGPQGPPGLSSAEVAEAVVETFRQVITGGPWRSRLDNLFPPPAADEDEEDDGSDRLELGEDDV